MTSPCPNGRRLADVELVLVDEARDARRYYAIRVRRSLFEHALEITEGRLEWAKRSHVEAFGSDAELARRYDELLARRRRHGYRPLVEWRDRGVVGGEGVGSGIGEARGKMRTTPGEKSGPGEKRGER
jgi:predicted DNA-binding WGR domain protein